MENIFYTILGALIAFFGYSYYIQKGVNRVEKKITKRKSEIKNMSLVNLVNLANSIVGRRSKDNK